MSTNKTAEEHKFTSTGVKFFSHMDKMENYKNGNPNTIISTHISPEGRCNLKCPYCSVTYRKIHNRIDLDKIKRYVLTLKKYGLKAAILTGGGEPTMYPHFNELVRWLKNDQGLDVALITNGTRSKNVDCWDLFTWVRVSFNYFPGWKDQIWVDKNLMNPNSTLGGSFVYSEVSNHSTIERFMEVSEMAKAMGMKYVRVLPNCLYEQGKLNLEHKKLKKLMSELNDPRFFRQQKNHETPSVSICHQSYFRPYLSEVGGGTVYPCDSVVLNDSVAIFSEKYQLCDSDDVANYIEKRFLHKFDPRVDCSGCVFNANNTMLDEWVNMGKYLLIDESLIHDKNFV